MTATSNIRYFYTCPLAAAWMSKYFGICFTKWQWNDLSFQFLPVGRDIDPDSSKLYIHPDSVSLLEPQVGDIGQDSTLRPYIRLSSKCWGDNVGNLLWDAKIRIIQRNGIAFIYPESEPVHLSREE